MSAAATTGYERLKPGPGRSHKSVAEHQRARICRAIVDLSADGGRKAVTVRGIVRLAGVSTGTFYTLFDGVDDCLVSASASVIGDVRERILARRSFRSSMPAQGEEAVRLLFDGLTTDIDASRLALIEVFAGGPAAIGAITSMETSLEEALRCSLNRRERQVSPVVVSWIVAGALTAARGYLTASPAPSRMDAAKRLVNWAGSCLGQPDDGLFDRLSSPTVVCRRPSGSEVDSVDEREMLRTAVRRLALGQGYWKLSTSRISEVAGVPRTHFRRHFRDLDDAYLEVIDQLAQKTFESIRQRPDADDWTVAVCKQVAALAWAIEADRDAARLVLDEISAPGLRGMRRKEAVLDRLALFWNSSVPPLGRIADARIRTGLAGLWTALSRSNNDGRLRSAPEDAPIYAYLILAPAVGRRTASAAVARGFCAPSDHEKAFLHTVSSRIDIAEESWSDTQALAM